MNAHWRDVLRHRALASVCIHRKPALLEEFEPAIHVAHPSPLVPTFPQHFLPTLIPAANGVVVMQPRNLFRHYPRPYIHIIVKKEFAEPWMTEHASSVPTRWLNLYGFHRMEYYDVKVSVARADK